MVWERIHELEEQEEQRKRNQAEIEMANRIKAENEATVKARQAEQMRIAENKRQLREAEEKRRLTKELLEKSGILPGMREIEKGLKDNVRKHAIIEDLNSGSATLVWGNKFKTTFEGKITYEKFLGISYTGIMDYSYIKVEVNSSSQSVSIRGKEVTKDQWSTNGGIVQDLLAQAYLQPYRVNDREERPKKYSSSGGGGMTECCSQ